MNCFVCNSHVTSYEHYLSHLKTHRIKHEKYSCINCNDAKNFISGNSFRRHLKFHFDNHLNPSSKGIIQNIENFTISDNSNT